MGMKSPYNFLIEYEDGSAVDMDMLGLWVESFHIRSPDVERTYIEIPNRDGAQLATTRIKIRKVVISFQIEANSLEELDTLKHDIYRIFFEVEEFKIIRDITPNKYIHVVQDGEYDIENITPEDGELSIELTMLDPVINGDESTIPITDGYIFNNPGTKETFPTFKATMTADTTFLSIVTKDDYIMIGEPATVEQSQVPKEQVILDDNMASITGWTNPNIVVDGGTVTGTMASDGFVFHASDYGLGDTWHGPVLAKGLSEPLQDFILETTINLACVSEDEIGRVELYLLDINNVIIGKIAMKDSTGGSELNMPEFLLRNGATNTPILVRTAQDNWQDFYGMLRLKREGQNFQAYLSHMDVDTGQHTVSRSTSFLDTNNEFQAKLASVAIHIAGYGTYATPNKNRVHHLTVKKVNSIADMQVPFVAAAGDVIEFDHAKALILKNGEPFMSEKDFASNFFALGKGETEIKVHPQGVANVEMIYRPRWL